MKERLASARVDTISLYFSKDGGMSELFWIHGLRFDKHSVPVVEISVWV